MAGSMSSDGSECIFADHGARFVPFFERGGGKAVRKFPWLLGHLEAMKIISVIFNLRYAPCSMRDLIFYGKEGGVYGSKNY